MKTACPSCGGSGGGPFGRAGGAWDTEEYVCARCSGTGMVLAEAPRPSTRPGVAKAQQAPASVNAPAAAAGGAKASSGRKR